MKTMKKLLAMSFLASMLFGAFAFTGAKSAQRVEAHSVNPYPSNGRSGTLLFVNGQGTYFKSGEADLAICCIDSSSNYAWSDKCTYRAGGDNIRVMIPYLNGQAHTWSRFKICRYNPSMNPATDGDGGVYNETEFIYFSSFIGQQNLITINGYGSGKTLNYAEMKSYISYFGVQSDTHIYLDLSSHTDWEVDNAKFAIWFAYPDTNNESGWGQSYYNGNYYSSFCWKVNGQDNEHLYECVVPSYGGATVWNMVIAVRMDKDATTPNWDQAYNQTQDLIYNSTNQVANMIRVTGWEQSDSYLDKDNPITRQSRLDFYGQYFLDTVGCSGTGDSDSTTAEMWTTVQYEYEHQLSRTFQGEVWKTVANKEGTLIAQAMARYDYIVLYKQYDHVDYINRAESPNASSYAYTYSNDLITNDNIIIIVAIIVALSTLTLASLIILKRHKHR